MPNTCGECRWWNAVGGKCHRYPPKVVVIQDYEAGVKVEVERTVYPDAYSADFCGEFTPREDGKNGIM